MLKQRVITALILIPVFVALVLILSPQWFCILTGVLVLLCAWEWSALMGVTRFAHRCFYLIFIALLLITALTFPIPFVLSLACVWWLIATLLIVLYPKANQVWGRGMVLRALMGIVVLIPCWLALNLLRNVEHGTYVLLFLFVLIWGADSGAYFVGKKWGKDKLLPLVSPGKTRQGLYGALFTTLIIVFIALIGFQVPWSTWPGYIVLSLITVLFSVVGDLFESMLKRKEGLKDSGQLLPGHGGILDRIDSLTAAAPIFALGLLLMGKIYY